MTSPITRNKILIERRGSLQTETNVETGEIFKSKIQWVSPCEYQIISTTNNKKIKDNIDSFFSITPINVIITNTGKDFYVFKAESDSVNKHVEFSDTLHIVH